MAVPTRYVQLCWIAALCPKVDKTAAIRVSVSRYLSAGSDSTKSDLGRNKLKQRSHTETDGAYMCPTFSDVEKSNSFHHEVDNKLPVVSVVGVFIIAVPYTTGVVDHEC